MLDISEGARTLEVDLESTLDDVSPRKERATPFFWQSSKGRSQSIPTDRFWILPKPSWDFCFLKRPFEKE